MKSCETLDQGLLKTTDVAETLFDSLLSWIFWLWLAKRADIGSRIQQNTKTCAFLQVGDCGCLVKRMFAIPCRLEGKKAKPGLRQPVPV